MGKGLSLATIRDSPDTDSTQRDRQQASFLPNVSPSSAFPPCHAFPVVRPAFRLPFIPSTIAALKDTRTVDDCNVMVLVTVLRLG
jgi:hypothetical protein